VGVTVKGVVVPINSSPNIEDVTAMGKKKVKSFDWGFLDRYCSTLHCL